VLRYCPGGGGPALKSILYPEVINVSVWVSLRRFAPGKVRRRAIWRSQRGRAAATAGAGRKGSPLAGPSDGGGTTGTDSLSVGPGGTAPKKQVAPERTNPHNGSAADCGGVCPDASNEHWTAGGSDGGSLSRDSRASNPPEDTASEPTPRDDATPGGDASEYLKKPPLEGETTTGVESGTV
jgi:hypothetical protein